METIIGSVLIVGLTFAFIVAAIGIRTWQLESDVQTVIEEYRSKLNGANRFLIDESIIQDMFPNYHRYIVRRVWQRLINTKAIDRDPLDGAWSIR